MFFSEMPWSIYRLFMTLLHWYTAEVRVQTSLYQGLDLTPSTTGTPTAISGPPQEWNTVSKHAYNRIYPYNYQCMPAWYSMIYTCTAIFFFPDTQPVFTDVRLVCPSPETGNHTGYIQPYLSVHVYYRIHCMYICVSDSVNYLCKWQHAMTTKRIVPWY